MFWSGWAFLLFSSCWTTSEHSNQRFFTGLPIWMADCGASGRFPKVLLRHEGIMAAGFDWKKIVCRWFPFICCRWHYIDPYCKEILGTELVRMNFFQLLLLAKPPQSVPVFWSSFLDLDPTHLSSWAQTRRQHIQKHWQELLCTHVFLCSSSFHALSCLFVSMSRLLCHLFPSPLTSLALKDLAEFTNGA